MTDSEADNLDNNPEATPTWANPVTRLKVTESPAGAVNLNLDNREVLSPLQGFGKLWQKTYEVRLPDLQMTPVEVMDIWKAEFPSFQPADSRFHPPPEGIRPGSIMFIDLDLPVVPGLGNAIPVASGVMILYVDDESFTVMTPQGFPISGWNTFSVYEDEAGLVAQIKSLDRATDPIYEFGSILMGGHRRQENNWKFVLRSLATRFHADPIVQMKKELIDPQWQWSEAGNIWYNAGVRTILYRLTTPLRYVRKRRK